MSILEDEPRDDLLPGNAPRTNALGDPGSVRIVLPFDDSVPDGAPSEPPPPPREPAPVAAPAPEKKRRGRPPKQRPAPTPAPVVAAGAPVPFVEEEEEKLMSPINPQKPTEGIPYGEIRDLAASHGYVSVRVSRKDSRGKYGVLGQPLRMTPEELSEIEGFIQDNAGGGEYEILVRAVSDPTLVLLRFAFRVEGPPKAYAEMVARAQAAAADPMAPRGVYPPGVAPPVIGTDEWTASIAAAAGGRMPSGGFGVPPASRAYQATSSGAAYNERPAPGATFASDEIAVAELRQARQEHRALQNEYAKLYAQLEEQRRRAEQEAAASRLRAQEAELKREIELLKLQMNMHQQRPAEKNLDVVGLVTALAPIATAMLQTNATSAREAAALQTQGMKTLMDATLAQASRPGELEKMISLFSPLLTLVLPLAKDFLANKDNPDAQVKLISALAESQLNNIGMAAQLVDQFASDRIPPEHPGVQIVKQLIEGGMTAAQAYFAEQAARQGGQALPAPAAPAGAIAAGEEREEEEAAAPAPAPAPRRPPPTRAQAQHAAPPAAAPAPAAQPNGGPLAGHPMFALLPASFKTTAWLKLLEAVHAAERPPVDAMGQVLAFHLQHCLVFNEMPPELAGLQERPTDVLLAAFAFLPINQQAPDYVRAVVAKAVDLLANDGHVTKPSVAPAPKKAASSAQPKLKVVESPEEPDEEDDADGGEEPEDTPTASA